METDEKEKHTRPRNRERTSYPFLRKVKVKCAKSSKATAANGYSLTNARSQIMATLRRLYSKASNNTDETSLTGRRKRTGRCAPQRQVKVRKYSRLLVIFYFQLIGFNIALCHYGFPFQLWPCGIIMLSSVDHQMGVVGFGLSIYGFARQQNH